MAGVRLPTTTFLDDNLDIERSFDLSHTNAQAIKSDVKSSGLVANDDKSVWAPTQHITWLGLNWNGENGTISIAAHRLEKLASTLNNILKQTEVTARQLAQVVGQIVSTGSVTGNLARILSRHCQISIAAVDNWDSPFSLDKYCLEELNFWLDNVDKFSARVRGAYPRICSRSPQSIHAYRTGVQLDLPRIARNSLRNSGVRTPLARVQCENRHRQPDRDENCPSGQHENRFAQIGY